MSKSIEERIIDAAASSKDPRKRIEAVRLVLTTEEGRAAIEGVEDFDDFEVQQRARSLDALLSSMMFTAPEIMAQAVLRPMLSLVLSKGMREVFGI